MKVTCAGVFLELIFVTLTAPISVAQSGAAQFYGAQVGSGLHFNVVKFTGTDCDGSRSTAGSDGSVSYATAIQVSSLKMIKSNGQWIQATASSTGSQILGRECPPMFHRFHPAE